MRISTSESKCSYAGGKELDALMRGEVGSHPSFGDHTLEKAPVP